MSNAIVLHFHFFELLTYWSCFLHINCKMGCQRRLLVIELYVYEGSTNTKKQKFENIVTMNSQGTKYIKAHLISDKNKQIARCFNVPTRIVGMFVIPSFEREKSNQQPMPSPSDSYTNCLTRIKHMDLIDHKKMLFKCKVYKQVYALMSGSFFEPKTKQSMQSPFYSVKLVI